MYVYGRFEPLHSYRPVGTMYVLYVAQWQPPDDEMSPAQDFREEYLMCRDLHGPGGTLEISDVSGVLSMSRASSLHTHFIRALVF